MRIGMPKEIKNHEFRVAITPSGAAQCIAAGHELWLQAGAGQAVGFSDTAYLDVGVTIKAAAQQVFSKCELVVKVKEPQTGECELLQAGQCVFSYLHLAA